MEDHKGARPHFERYFKYLLQREISPQTVIEMLNVVNKIVVCLNEEGDPQATQNFVESVIKIFEKILTISKEKGLSEFLSKDFLETLILDLLDIFYLKGNFQMLYYLLTKAAEHKCFTNGSFINNKQVIKVVHLCIKTASYLRSSPESLPRIPLTKAISLLKYGKSILKTIPETEETQKLDLLLTFNQGVYHLEKEDFFKSKTLFDKCLEKYPQLMGKSDHKFFRILYNIGLSLYNLKKFQEALHFFEKIYRQLVNKHMDNLKNQLEKTPEKDSDPHSQMRPEESDLFLRVIKILAKIYYRLGQYDDCHSVLNSYINSILEKDSLPPGFFKYLTMYYLCCQRIKSADFHNLFDKVLQKTKSPESSQFSECQHYFNLFFHMNKVSLEKQDCPEYPNYQRFVQKMAKKEGTPEKFISTLNLMYSKFSNKDNDEALELNIDLIKQLREKNVSISENAQKIENFLFNFLFIIVHKLNASKTSGKELPKTAKILDDIRNFKEQHQIYDKIYELLADPNYNSLYNSALNIGHKRHIESQVFDNQTTGQPLVREDSIDGTDFTITDAPMEVAEFDPLRTFEDKRTFRIESEYKRSKAKSFLIN
jgi:tetratricopeptide (TPR) repeat protein